MAAQFDTRLQDSDYWTPEQFADAADLPGAERVALTEPAQVPVIHMLRREDRVWRPEDYDALPKKEAASPGYTMMRDVGLVAPGMLLTEDGRYVRDPMTRLTPARVSPAFERDLEIGAQRRREWEYDPEALDRGILIAGPGIERFGHNLLDFLPGLAMLDQFGVFTDWPLLLPEQVPSWIPPMVEIYSGRQRVIKRFSHRRHLRVRVRELCVPWIVRKPAFHPSVAEVFEKVAARATGNGAAAAPGRRICILRGKDQDDKRGLTNAEALDAMLLERGLEGVSPERMPFVDQVRLFAETEFAVGQAGSALHGVVFSKPGTAALELRPENYDVHGQSAIAVLRRQTFASVKGDQDGGRMSRAPWTLDLELVEQRLGELGL